MSKCGLESPLMCSAVRRSVSTPSTTTSTVRTLTTKSGLTTPASIPRHSSHPPTPLSLLAEPLPASRPTFWSRTNSRDRRSPSALRTHQYLLPAVRTVAVKAVVSVVGAAVNVTIIPAAGRTTRVLTPCSWNSAKIRDHHHLP